jgi:hypothetical protein
VASGPTQLIERVVEEAAVPGQPAHACAFPIFPRQFTLENCRSAAGVAAIVVRQALEGPTYSVNPLCGRLFRAATEKPFALVQKLWTMRLPCGKLRKTENEFYFDSGGHNKINNLYDVKQIPPMSLQPV